jgi:hypothetical protein
MVPISLLFVLSALGFGNSIDIFPWETYLELGSVENPLGLTINQSSLAHRHFFIGYLCLHSFMYDTAQEAFQLAIDSDPTLVEPHIGRLLGFVYIISTLFCQIISLYDNSPQRRTNFS